MIPSKKSTLFLLAAAAILAAGCSHAITTTGGGGGTGGENFSISGTVVGLTGTGLVIANGSDTLNIKTTGKNVNFTFKSTTTGPYQVTVQTEPSNPAQNCSVMNGTGTATANVTNVEVTCGIGVTIGGTISGLLGSGMVLQDNGADNLAITGTGNVSFTFPTPLIAGTAYTVTISKQPTNPQQVCTLANATGTANSSVNNVQISCPQPKYKIGGTVVGLVTGAGDTLELQDNAGDNLFVTGDTTFTFPTAYTSGTTYSVNVFLEPTSQPLVPCNVFNASSVVTGDVSNVLVDCQHNDWAWMFSGPGAGPSMNQYGAADLPGWVFGTTLLPPPYSTSNGNTPGGRDFPMAWTDLNGNRWLFGGYGFEVKHTPTDGLPGYLNDMWVWPIFPNEDDGWWNPGAWIPADVPIAYNSQSNTYSADIAPLQFKNSVGNYGTQGVGTACSLTVSICTVPGARWGGVTWNGPAGNLWMFGGQGVDSNGNFGLLNDMWVFDITSGPCSYDLTTGTGIFTNCKWIWEGGQSVANQPTTATFPGGRWGAASYTDNAGNVWVFGGQGYDSGGNLGLLNDLWKYSTGTGVWTLVSGSTTFNQNGVYGTMGTGAAGSVPGGRQTGVLWVDSTGNIWLFGGFGLDSAGTSLGPGQIGAILNDLWEYSPGTGFWTWVSGGNLADQNGVYGVQTITAAGNFPGSRWGSMGWIDSSNKLWLFGGFGFGSVVPHPTGFLNDMWSYDPATGQWLWWKGSNDVNQSSTFITSPFNYFQLSYTNNAVGARRGAARWLPDSRGFVYMFGGEGYDATNGGPYGSLNDVWRYLPFP